MTVETETAILRAIENLNEKIENLNEKIENLDRKVDKLDHKVENIQKDLIDVKVAMARQEEQIKSLGQRQDDLKGELSTFKTETKEGFKEVRTELKETKTEVSGLYKWFVATLITAGIGVGTFLFRVFDLFPKA